MSSRWPTKTLAEVCQIKPPKAEARQRLAPTDLVSFVPMEDLGIDQKTLIPTQAKPLADVAGSYTYFADGDVLLAKITPCFENGKLGIAEGLTNRTGFGSSEFMVFRPDKSVDKEWLYYFLSRESFRGEGASRMSGAVGHKRVAIEFIESYPIPIPSVQEQQRIVAILDEAFEVIATAKANAEMNLQKAEELFESQLESTLIQSCNGSPIRALGDLCAVKTGKKDVNEGNPEGKYPFFTCAAKHTYSDSYSFDTEALLIAGNGDVGQISYYCGKFEAYQRTYVLSDFVGVSATYIYRVLDKRLKKTVSKQKLGNTMPYIKKGMITDFLVPVPSIKQQQLIAEQLDRFTSESELLETIYQKKIIALDELKQSLLHRAFNGDL